MSEERAEYSPDATAPAAQVLPEDLVQGSPAWHKARLGKFTASVVHCLLATRGDGKGRATLIRTLAAERLSGVPQGFEGNDDTDFGHEHEPAARRQFEQENGAFLELIGFITHPTMPYAGASPDGISRGEYGAEFKSHRKAKKFLEMTEGVIPRAHIIQCQMGMSCAVLQRWTYNNYCPEMPEGKRLHTRWVERDEKMIAELTVEIRRAEIEVAAKVAEYMGKSA